MIIYQPLSEIPLNCTKMDTQEAATAAIQEENLLLKKALAQKDDEINELRSQVDKYKSVLSMYDGYLSPGIPDQQLKPRKTRLLGISAEPESSLTYEELLQTKFADYKKTEKYVFFYLHA